jgi:ferredoxin-NADP reductase
LTFGQFAENFTVEGLADSEVCVGDRYRIGGAVFEAEADAPPILRSYSLSDLPDAGRYRISIKEEPHGIDRKLRL